jgi:lipopolysaccharide transport system permease protein
LISSALPPELQSSYPVRTIGPPAFSPWRLILQLGVLAQYWDLLVTLSVHRIKVRYKQSALGWGWALAQPVALMLIYTVIFSVVTRMPSDGTPYAVFVFAALLPWTFFATAMGSASNSLVSHSYLITKVYFPREILPLTYLAVALFDFLIAGTVLAAMMFWYGIVPSIQILWAIPAMGVAVVFVLGLSLALSSIQVTFRDIGLAIPLLLQIWMFATPVVYPLSAVPGKYRLWYICNPMVGVVETFRRAVLQGQGPDMTALGTGAAVSLVLLPIAFGFFKYREATIADVI